MSLRPLTLGEIYIAGTIFGSGIDYIEVGIYDVPWTSPLGGHPIRDRGHAPDGNIYFPSGSSGHGIEDFSDQGVDNYLESTFIHELVHIWQHQNGVNVPSTWAAGNGRGQGGPLDYDYGRVFEPGGDFWDLGIEEQAQFIRDYYIKLN